ncbi:hypothetical protein [uncultured Pseudoalteromonas sp.]
MKDYKRKAALLFGAVMVFNCAAHDTNTSPIPATQVLQKQFIFQC